jgi:hypothetical protein
MRIGVTIDRYQGIPASLLLCLLKWIGISFFEVTIHMIQNPKKAFNIDPDSSLGLHLPNVYNVGFDFSSLDKVAEINHTLKQIHLNRHIFQYAVVHPPQADTSSPALNYYITNLKQIQVPLVLENIPEMSFKNFNNFLNRIEKSLGKALGICLDIPHAELSGEEWKRYWHHFHDKIQVVHLSDCNLKVDLHIPFGLGGQIHLHSILSFLKQNFNGILNFEMQPPSLKDLDAYFDSVIQAYRLFEPGKVRWIKKRSKPVIFVGKALNFLLNYKL